MKNSSACLFAYLKAEQEKENSKEIYRVCEIAHEIFVKYQKIDRITVPMFRFLDQLFSSGYLGCVINEPNSELARKLLKLIQLEMSGWKDIYKIIDGINIICQFIQVYALIT